MAIKLKVGQKSFLPTQNHNTTIKPDLWLLNPFTLTWLAFDDVFCTLIFTDIIFICLSPRHRLNLHCCIVIDAHDSWLLRGPRCFSKVYCFIRALVYANLLKFHWKSLVSITFTSFSTVKVYSRGILTKAFQLKLCKNFASYIKSRLFFNGRHIYKYSHASTLSHFFFAS